MLAVTYAAAFLLHAGALWRDEVNSVDFATMPSLSSIWSSLRYDSFPVLPSLLLRGWATLGLGQTDAGLRLFGLLTGLACLGSIWLACKSLGSPSPVLALALAGINPWVVRGVGSVRPYGPGVVLILLTLAFLWRAAESPGLRRFLIAGLLAVLSVQCMYQNAFLLLAICLAAGAAALRASRPAALAGIAAVGAGAAASLGPYLPSIVASRDWSVVTQGPTTWQHILDVLSQAAGSSGVEAMWLWAAAAATCCVSGALALLGRAKPRQEPARSSTALFSALLLVAGTLLFLAAIKAARLPSQPWYYVPLLALLAPALEAGAWSVARGQAWRIGKLAIALLIAATTAIPTWRQVTERRTNMDAVSAHLAGGVSAGDLVVVYPFYYGVSFQRYYHGPAAWMTIPPLQDLRIHRYDLVKEAMIRPDPMRPLLDAMQASLRSGHKVWLVGGLPPLEGNQSEPGIVAAPHPVTGWQNGPYLIAWGREATYLLAGHALRAEAVPVPGGDAASRYERVTLFVATGWR